MGVEYALYEMRSKEFIDLGKKCTVGAFDTQKSRRFQLCLEVIAAFLSEHSDGKFEMHCDADNMPDEDDDDKPENERWKKRAAWWSPALDVFPPN